MITLRGNISGMPDLARRMGERPELVRAALEAQLKELTGEVRRDALTRVHRKSGLAARSIRRGVRVREDTVKGWVRAGNRTAFYVPWLEQGHYIRRGGGRRVSKVTNLKRLSWQARGGLRGVTWVPAYPFLQPAFDAVQPKVLPGLQGAVTKAVEGRA